MKISIKALVILTLAAAGCSKQPSSSVSSDQLNLKFDVVLSADNTKGTIDGDGTGAGADRCRLQIFMKSGSTSNRIYDATKTVKDFKTSFNDIILMKDQTYDFLFWSDNTSGDYYNTDDLHSVTLKKTYCGNDDKRDAFFSAIADTTVSESFTRTIYLKRPFAQLNVITNDVSKVSKQLPAGVLLKDVLPDKVKLTYTAPDTFNVLTATASGSKQFDWETSVYTSSYKTEDDALNTLSMDYIFASTTKTVNDISFVAKNTQPSSAMQDISLSFTNIPLQRNYRTNIIGSLLTNTTSITVEISPSWYEPEFEVKW